MKSACLTILVILFARVSVAERITCEREFTVQATFDDACHAVVISEPLRKVRYQYDPEYVSFERFCRQGRVLSKVQIARISVVTDILLKMEIWRIEEGTKIRLQASGLLPASRTRVMRGMVRRQACRRFIDELDAQERLIRKEVSAHGCSPK